MSTKTNAKILPKRSKNQFLDRLYSSRMSYLYLSPFLIIFTLFTIVPVITSIFYSFTYYDLLRPAKFIGWKNYMDLFLKDDIFIIAIRNTFIFAIITGPIGYIASLLIAWLLNEMPKKFRTFMVVVFYAPTISGQVYLIWSLFFSGDSYGYFNGFLLSMGLINEPVMWLTDPRYMMTIIIIVALWMSLGAGFLSFIAGLQGIPKEQYESGYVDGIKNRVQELWFITLPNMKPQLLFGAVMSVTASFASADIMTALAGFPSTDYQAYTIVSHLIDYGSIRFEWGYASAVATILFVSMLTINKLVQALLGRIGK